MNIHKLIFNLNELYIEEIKSQKYFNEYNNYEYMIEVNNKTEDEVKNYICKNQDYINFAANIKNQSPYINLVLSKGGINIISGGSVGDIGICIGDSSIRRNNPIITDFYEKYDKMPYYERENFADNFYRNLDIDAEYSKFISSVKKDYNKIKSIIKKIFKFDMYKLNLSLTESSYKKYKEMLQTPESFNWHRAELYFANFYVQYNILFKRKIYDQIEKESEIIVKRNLERKDRQPKKIDPEKIKQIHFIYDSFINWINNPRTISGHSNLSMYDIISIYVLFNKPISDLCNRCKRGKFDKIYKIDRRTDEYDSYFTKQVISAVGINSKIIEHGFEDDFVYNSSTNKIFYIGYEHGELISNFTTWDLLYVTEIFRGNITPDDVKQIIEDYDKEKGYNFI